MSEDVPQTASLAFRTKGAAFRARVQVTSGGLLAIGGLVGSILLSTAALVWAAGSVKHGKLLLK